jgi:hypothetical protein
MKKTLISLTMALAGGIIQAEYVVKFNLDEPVRFSNWTKNSSLYGDWENTGSVHSCLNWTPAASAITIGNTFTQTANDCKQDQIRTVQDQEIDNVSGSIRNIGNPYNESQSVQTTQTRSAVGTLETWVAIAADVTTWVNNGSVTSCTNWSPATSTVTSGQSFTQTATDCQQPQTRNKQNREQETTTHAIRNVGTVIVENQSITATSTRTSIGTKPATVCNFAWGSYEWGYQEDEGYITELTVLWQGNIVYRNYVNPDYLTNYPDVRGTDGKLYRRGPYQSGGYQVCQVN